MKPLLILVLSLLVSANAAAKDHARTVVVHVTKSKIDWHPYPDMPNIAFAVNVWVVMPDGSEAQLWCEQHVRYCTDLQPGDYKAEITNDVVWIYVELPAEKAKYSPDGSLLPRKMRLEKIKYHVAFARHREN
jgi:hypothetical protein